jgi:hypothetical protein
MNGLEERALWGYIEGVQMRGNILTNHWRGVLLIPILALAFYIAFIPHRGYAYPVHLDEWQVMTYTNQLIENGSTIALTNPLNGGPQNLNQVGELGDHVFWGIFREVTGIDWLPIFRYFPGVIYMITVLGVFILARRMGFEWQAAFFAALLPTTVGILGLAFLVPISLAMLFLPLALFTAFFLRGWWSYLVLSILVVAAAAIHPPTAAMLIVVLVPYGLLCLKGNFRHSLSMALAVGLPFVALFPVIYRMAVPILKRIFVEQTINPYVDLPMIIPKLGYVVVGLCLVGVAYLAWKGKKTDYGLILGTAAVLGVTAIYYTLHYGAEFVYYRGLQVGMLMVSILAGVGLGWIMSWRGVAIPDLVEGAPGRRGNDKIRVTLYLLSLPLALALIVMTLGTVIPARLSEPYYHMIDGGDYRAFDWIGQNVGEEYKRGLVDPWKGMAFTGVAEKLVYSMTGDKPDANAESAYKFLSDNGTDTNLLRANGISIVYTTGEVENPDLNEVRQGVYILKYSKPKS